MWLVYFGVSIFIICIAHYIRILRWELFIDIYEKPNKQNLIQAIAIGYLLNNIIPFKLGDFLRAWYSGRKMKNGIALGLSTVIVDRFLDIISVGLIFAILYFCNIKNDNIIAKSTLFYVFLAILVFILMIAFFLFRSCIKIIIRDIASIFNPHIETVILQFAWALIWNFKDIFQKISKIKLITSTIVMWICYLFSYYLFANSLKLLGADTTWTDLFIMLFAQSGIISSTISTFSFRNALISTYSLFTLFYLILPLIALIVFSLLVEPKRDSNATDENYLNLLPHLDQQERLDFLDSYFSNSNKEYIKNYLKINQHVSIIRDYSAGSKATTMLCMDSDSTFFRKYAFGSEGEKLYQQILWIEENFQRIPLPTILKKEKTGMYCYYDMPYKGNSVGLFEYAHSMPINNTWKMIQNVLERLEHSIYQINVQKADLNTIREYISVKVHKNIDIILSAKRIKNLQQYESIIINGVSYHNLSYYLKYLEEDYLLNIFKTDDYAVIHGDLTIENIICTRDDKGNDDFYIIDPNTGNIHNSPNLDYAKLLQSLHGGYEFLMSTKEVHLNGNRINFLFTRSSAYKELNNLFKEYLIKKYGYTKTRSIYYHELIHWLRLMPYKIEKDGNRSLLFYAGMLIVMNDVIKMFDNTES